MTAKTPATDITDDSRILEAFASSDRGVIFDSITASLIEEGRYAEALEVLAASRTENVTAERRLAYAQALLLRAQDQCSLPDALEALFELELIPITDALARDARDLSGSVLRLLDLSAPETEELDHPAAVKVLFQGLLRDAEAGRMPKQQIQQLAIDSPWHARQLAEQVALPRYAELLLAGQERAASLVLEVAKDVAKELGRNDRGELLRESLSVVMAAAAAGQPQSSDRLAQALVSFGQGAAAYHDQLFKTAEDKLSDAEATFNEYGLPLAHWARFYRLIGLYYKNTEAALLGFESLARLAETHQYLDLLGRASWLAGTARLVRDEFDLAAQFYERARSALELSGGPEASAFVLVLLAEAETLRGNHQQAWTYRSEAFREVPSVESLRRQIAMLWEAAEALKRQGRDQLAKPILDKALALSERWGQPLGLSTALLSRAQWLSRHGMLTVAAQDLERAQESVSQMEEGPLKQEREATIELVHGLLEAQTNPQSALVLLDAAFERQRLAGRQIELLQSIPVRADVLERLHRPAEAKSDLREALRLFEEARVRTKTPASRIYLARQARPSAEHLVRLMLNSGETLGALAVAESIRAASHDSATRQTVGETDKQPPLLPFGLHFNHTVIAMFETAKQTMVWTIGPNSPTPRIRILLTDEVSKLVSNLQSLGQLGAPGDDLKEPLSDLYDALLADVNPLERTIAFVPDAATSRIPFAALYDQRSDRFLYERSNILVLSGLQGHQRGTQKKARVEHQARDLLAVGVSAAAATSLGLPALQGVTEEAQTVSQAYRNSMLLANRDATKLTVIRSLRSGYNVLHFAGHAVSNTEAPRSSYLLVNGDTAEDSQLSVEALEMLDLDHIELVFLSACSTLGPIHPNEGPAFGLAGAFLSAGVRAVVANSLPVSDADASAFARSFHRAFAAGDTLTSSYRSAIDAVRASGGRSASPASWGNWILVASSVQLSELDHQVRPSD